MKADYDVVSPSDRLQLNEFILIHWLKYLYVREYRLRYVSTCVVAYVSTYVVAYVCTMYQNAIVHSLHHRSACR